MEFTWISMHRKKKRKICNNTRTIFSLRFFFFSFFFLPLPLDSLKISRIYVYIKKKKRITHVLAMHNIFFFSSSSPFFFFFFPQVNEIAWRSIFSLTQMHTDPLSRSLFSPPLSFFHRFFENLTNISLFLYRLHYIYLIIVNGGISVASRFLTSFKAF